MTTAVTLFESGGAVVPSYLLNSAAAKALKEQMEGGLAGRSINRISLRNGKFRFLKAGTEVGVVQGELPVVIIAANPHVGRLFWIKPFDGQQEAVPPDCYSKDGVTPEADAPARQSDKCATCPKNAVGSANNGVGKACSYKKRVIVVSPSKIDGDVYALDVGAMSMFGNENAAQRLYSLKGYIEALKVNGLIVPSVITKLSFDDEESVPKLHFTPVRVLTEAEWKLVEARVADPAVREMLDDTDYKAEASKSANGAAAPAQVAAPAAQAAQAAQAVPPQQPAAQPAAPATPPPARSRTRAPKAETAPVQAPAPAAPPPADFGFPTGTATPQPTAAPVQGFPAGAAPATPAAPAVGNTAPPGFSVDLNEFDD